jgi:hypothetical protein
MPALSRWIREGTLSLRAIRNEEGPLFAQSPRWIRAAGRFTRP